MSTQSTPSSKRSREGMKEAYLKQLFTLAGNQETYSNKIKAQVIYELKHKYDVLSLVEVADMPRSTYYYWEKRMNRPDKYAEVKKEILAVAHLYNGRYAYRRITDDLMRKGVRHDPKTILRLMGELGL
ncbi:IS3 family transposase [Rossellomorea marisflavi]|uniref:IS3 family transposase n=1 Tax=Rossellomorea marisflavi TaxID=189381 RepID=UPI0011E7A98A|nr:IS3 family transposase [Rossellomorea marisflavi]TYO74374.1 IS3 family transposase [Rossellomorea marisflavi]